MSENLVPERQSSRHKFVKRKTFQVISPAKTHDNKFERSSSFTYKTITKASTTTKSSLDVQKMSEEELLKVPRKILKYKSSSPQKAFKRLQSLGGNRKSKGVVFKQSLTEIKNVPSLVQLVYKTKQFPLEDLNDTASAKCTCACIVY